MKWKALNPARWGVLAVLLGCLYGCGGGGGGSGGGAPPVTPEPFEVADSALPLELVKVPLTIPGTVTGVQQTSGPTVSSLTYDNSVLSFVTPGDTGKDEKLTFKFTLDDKSTLEHSVTMTALISPPITAQESGGADGLLETLVSDLTVTVPALAAVNILPANFADFSLVFSSSSGASVAPDSLRVTLHNGIDAYVISDYFSVNQQSGVVTLKTASKADFIAKLSDNGIEMSVAGLDNTGFPFGFDIAFFFGTNTINGKVIDSTGATVTSLAGKSVVLSGFTTGLTRSAVISDSGSFAMTHVATDNYYLSLIDPDGQYNGTSLFLIESGGSTVTVSMTVSGGTLPKAAGKIVAGSRNVVRIKNSAGIPAFRKNEAIKPRNIPITVAKTVPATAGNTVSVVGGAKEVTIEDSRDIQLPQGTKGVVIHAAVTTDEYPAWCTKPDNKYNDTWRFWWSCNSQAVNEVGLVNKTHSATGTRLYDYPVDLSAAAATKPVTCKIGASTTNIGDGALPTRVTISLEGEAGLTVKKVYHKSGLFHDRLAPRGNGRYNLSIPLTPGTAPGVRREWIMGVDYEPKNADIKKVKLDLQYNGSTYTINNAQPFIKISDGLLKVPVTLVQGLPVTPSGNLLASVSVTLTGEVGGTSYTSLPKTMKLDRLQDTFQPLFEILNSYTIDATSRRFGEQLEDLAVGSDGWGRMDMLVWLTSGAGALIPFNDISGEHAWQDSNERSLGIHVSHKGGYDVDLRYLDENGKYLGDMMGVNDGVAIKNALYSAQAAYRNLEPNNPDLVKVIGWIKANRNGISEMAKDTAIKVIIVGRGTKIDENSYNEWHRRALSSGLFPDGTPIPSSAVPDQEGVFQQLGGWLNKPSKVVEIGGHEGHIHVRLNP